MGRGYAWLDTGTHDSLIDASNYIRTIESRQGLKIACLEVIACKMGYIHQTATVTIGRTPEKKWLWPILDSTCQRIFMRFTRLNIPELVLIEPVILGDDRGYFSETFRQQDLDAFLGQTINFCQDSESKSSFGVLRGLHYQLAPHAQTKVGASR